MTRLLIADDNEDYREQLAFALARRGYTVKTAVSGREVIDVGCGYRPEILITDWVLLDQIHGLQVAAVLRLMHPDLRVVLMSGFSSSDLEFEAGLVGVSELVEKPFEIDRMVRAVAFARSDARSPSASPVGFLETAADGEVLYANPRAVELLNDTRGGHAAKWLRQILPREDWAGFDDSTREWIEVRPLAERPVVWQVRSRRRPGGEGYHVVLIPGDRCLASLGEGPEPYSYDFLVRLLLELPVVEPVGDSLLWPFAGRALMIAASDLYRRLVVAEIERAGGMCHSAESCQAAVDIFQRDPEIDIVLLGGCQLGPRAADFIDRIRASSRPVVIVGQGLSDSRPEFVPYGVDFYLPVPWEVEDLIRVVTN